MIGSGNLERLEVWHTDELGLTSKECKIKALLDMLPWGRRDVLGSMNGKYEGVYVKYASLIVSRHWIKVFISAW